MMNNLFKFWTGIIILLFVPILAHSQTTLRDSVEQSIDYIETDLIKAESLLRINKDKLSQEPDSIIFDYYYYSAAVLEFKNDTTLKKTELLLKAKALMEKSLGINQAVYFEIVNAIGEQLYDKNKIEEAKLIWEEGLIKGLRFVSYKEYPIGKNINLIRSNLSLLYDKIGDSYISTWLKVNHTKGTFDYACELWDKALAVQRSNPALSLKLLDEAKVIFMECGEEGQEMMGPLYRVYISTYAYLNESITALKLIKKHKELIISSASYDSYIEDLFSLVNIFTITHYDVKKARPFWDILKNDVSRASDKTLKQYAKIEKGYMFHCNLQNKIDSLNTKLSMISKNHIEKYTECAYSLCLLYLKRNQYEKVQNISDECNDVLKLVTIQYQELRWKFLSLLINTSFQLKKYTLCEKYLDESIIFLNKENSKTPSFKKNISWIYNVQSICLIKQNKLEEALVLNTKVLQYYESIFGPNSLEYSSALHNKGRIYQLKQKYKIARDLYNQSLKISRILHQEDNQRTLQYLSEVEKILNAQL